MTRIFASLAVILSMSTAVTAKDSLAAEREDAATRLLGVSTFVTDNCPNMTVNKLMIRTVFDMLGVNPAVLANNERRMTQAGLVTAAFKSNVKLGCAAAWKAFGSDGESLPGVITKD